MQSNEGLKYLEDNGVDLQELKKECTTEWKIIERKISNRTFKFEARLNEAGELELQNGKVK